MVTLRFAEAEAVDSTEAEAGSMAVVVTVAGEGKSRP
jgi:hypothetical protein